MDAIDKAKEEQLLEESERRRFIYSDLELMLDYGYLEHTITWLGVPICFRTLLTAENQLLISRLSGTVGLEWKVWYVCSHIYSVGHFVCEGPNSAWYLWEFWAKSLSSQELDPMVSVIVGLRKRVDRCYKLVEAYSFESYSRSAWKIKRASTHKDLHLLQQVWESINIAEDLIEEDIRMWAHTRSVVGAMSSKGAKSLKQSEDKFLQKRTSRYQKVIEDTVNTVLFGDRKKEPEYIEIGGQKVLMPNIESSQTVEEMEEEMARIMRGEEDFHDMVVRQYKERAKARIQEAKEAREKAREEAMGHVEESVASQLVGYTEEQLKALGVKDRKATSVDPIPESDQAFLEYLEKPIKVGWIGLSGIPEEAKEKSGGETLQDRMSRRKPTMK